MIKSIEIKNIQSHEHTKLDFSNGINVIIGSSNQGKSAVLRALYWVRTNRPLGIDTLASHWISNDKSGLISTMSVKLVNDKGSVERRRTKEENQYIVNDEVLNVVKTDVPEQVSSILKLSDTNVQKQLDSPFLLSQTSGEVAKYFNQIVNLDVIDRVLTNAESRRRKLNSTIDSTKEEIDKLKEKIESFSWVDNAIEIMNDYLAIKEERDCLLEKINDLEISFSSYSNCYEWLNWCNEVVLSNKKTINEIELNSHSISEVGSNLDRLGYSINSYNSIDFYEIAKEKEFVSSLNKQLDDLVLIMNKFKSLEYSINEIENLIVYDFESQKKWFMKIDFIRDENDKINLYELNTSIKDYDELSSLIVDNEITIKKYKGMLPNVCPLCGSILEGGKCVSC